MLTALLSALLAIAPPGLFLQLTATLTEAAVAALGARQTRCSFWLPIEALLRSHAELSKRIDVISAPSKEHAGTSASFAERNATPKKRTAKKSVVRR